MNLTALTGYKIDLSSRFEKLSESVWNGCNFTSYRIDKVVEKTTTAEIAVETYSTLFSLDQNSGILNMTRFDFAY